MDDFKLIQSFIENRHRAVMVDWLIEKADEYRTQTGTLFAAVHLLDKLLRVMNIDIQEFQLYGCACLVIAAKLEEVQVLHPPGL